MTDRRTHKRENVKFYYRRKSLNIKILKETCHPVNLDEWNTVNVINIVNALFHEIGFWERRSDGISISDLDIVFQLWKQLVAVFLKPNSILSILRSVSIQILRHQTTSWWKKDDFFFFKEIFKKKPLRYVYIYIMNHYWLIFLTGTKR